MSAMQQQSPSPAVLGIPVRTYQDPVQSSLTRIFAATEKSELVDVQSVVTDLARRRMFGLPLDLTELEVRVGVAVEDLEARGLSSDAKVVSAESVALARSSRLSHPLDDEPIRARDRTILVPDDLLDECGANRPAGVRADESLVSVSAWREICDAPGPRAAVEAWLEAEREAQSYPHVTLMAWPSAYYVRHWFENHTWLWFTPAHELRVPLELVSSLAPRLWVVSAFAPGGQWARTMNARMRRQAATVTRSPFRDEGSADSNRQYVYAGSHAEHVEVRAFCRQGSRSTVSRIPSYQVQIWDADARDLKPIHCAPGTVIEEPVTLIHFVKNGPLEVNQALASWANPLAHAVAVWRRAAAAALASATFETDRRKLRAVAEGRQMRFHDMKQNEILYRDLSRFADDDFKRIFPDLRRTRAIWTKWHSAQSAAGREGVRHLEDALATLGTDAPEIAALVDVIHCNRLEIHPMPERGASD